MLSSVNQETQTLVDAFWFSLEFKGYTILNVLRNYLD